MSTGKPRRAGRRAWRRQSEHGAVGHRASHDWLL